MQRVAAIIDIHNGCAAVYQGMPVHHFVGKSVKQFGIIWGDLRANEPGDQSGLMSCGLSGLEATDGVARHPYRGMHQSHLQWLQSQRTLRVTRFQTAVSRV
ncbi:hypothetical protein B0X78_13140 [bacterium AM6]|nr:hypothetical protein B0X78_13140 [bacterium AM6]